MARGVPFFDTLISVRMWPDKEQKWSLLGPFLLKKYKGGTVFEPDFRYSFVSEKGVPLGPETGSLGILERVGGGGRSVFSASFLRCN